MQFFKRNTVGLGYQFVTTGLGQKNLHGSLPVARATVARATVAHWPHFESLDQKS